EWSRGGGESCPANIMPSKHGGYYYYACRDTDYLPGSGGVFIEGFPFVARYDTAMNEIWKKEFRPKEVDIPTYSTGKTGYISMVRELNNEEAYIMCGEITDTSNQTLGLMKKFSKTGEILWERKHYYPRTIN